MFKKYLYFGIVSFCSCFIFSDSFKEVKLRSTPIGLNLAATEAQTQLDDAVDVVVAASTSTVGIRIIENILSPHTLKMNTERHKDAIRSYENLFPWHNLTHREDVMTSPVTATTTTADTVSWKQYSYPLADNDYSQENYPRPPFGMNDLLRISLHPLLSDEECQILIDEADETTSQRVWIEGNARHGTQSDRVGALLPLERLPNSNKLISEELLPKLFQSVVDAFECLQNNNGEKGRWDDLRIGGARVVRYEKAKGQVELGMHRDSLSLTVNIALNDPNEYENGGTIVEAISTETPIRLQKGHALLHPSDVRHAASPITSGKRYVLVLFLVSKTIIPHDRYVGEWAERCMGMAANTPSACNNRSGNDSDSNLPDEKDEWLQKAAGYYSDVFALGGRMDRGLFPWFYHQAGLSETS